MVVAKIEAIDLDKPWYYTACNFCKRKMARQGDGFEGNVQHLQHNPIYNCKTCNKDFEHAIHCVFFSYYLVVRVSDDSKGKVKFLLFNNIAERLIRRPAFELVQEAGQENPYFLPQSLTDLIGRKLLFKITIGSNGQQEQNTAYVVDLVIDDSEIIQHFDPHVTIIIRSNPLSTDTGNKPQKKKKQCTNDKENSPMGNITQNSSITNVSPLPSINPFRTPFQNVTNQVFRPIIPIPPESNSSKNVENTSTHTVPLSCVFQSFKDGLTHQARAARKEILNNKRTIGLTTSNRGTIGYQETISRSTSISLRKRKTIGSPPSVNSKTRHKEARQGPNMTRQTNPTGPAVSIADAPREGNFLDICNRTNMIPFQQTKTNEFIPPPRFIVEDHPEAYNNRYAMESESENENDNEDEENQTYTSYPAGETLLNTSPQHIPQQTNNTVTSPIVIGIQKNGYYDDGDPGWNCKFCQAYMWYGESIGKRRLSANPVFTMCCKRGKVVLPRLANPPMELMTLLCKGDELSKHYREFIRAYNMMFSFTSLGGKIDHSINNGRGPFVFRMSGENYHRIGDIVPEPGQAPKFSQLYIIDTLNEIKNRLDAYAGSDRAAAKKLREPLVLLLKNMLDQCNPHVKAFRSARDRFDVEGSTGYRMRLIESRQSDGRTHNLPTANEVAALIPGDFVLNMETRDIVLESTSGKLQRIREEKVYLSSDSIIPSDVDTEENVVYPAEFLNSVKVAGLPRHCLKLKVGAPIMCLRNMDVADGLCNGTRLIVTQLLPHVIEGRIITGNKIAGHSVWIPRMSVTPPDTKFPFRMRRRQFPVTLAFAMTINKSQGQTLESVRLFLPRPVFSHGQLYVALSRVKSRENADKNIECLYRLLQLFTFSIFQMGSDELGDRLHSGASRFLTISMKVCLL
ncbi:unnamed protein product [Brassica napus]|uniref:(rape) hypothetical protein n=1 Tax=Brassica napus TaxID=3708 RepID=A0A816TL17_BRANA|nr:unnamed protein product [Brassica napus]